MSVSPIDESTATATDNSAKVQLARDQKKLAADIQAHASQVQIAADNLAITNDQLAVTRTAAPGIDTYL